MVYSPLMEALMSFHYKVRHKVLTNDLKKVRISNGKVGWFASARLNPPKAGWGGAGQAELGRQTQYYNPPHLRVGWQVSPPIYI